MVQLKFVAAALTLTLTGAAVAGAPYGAAAAPAQHAEHEDLTIRGEPPMLGLHWSREMHSANQARTRNPNMTYHGGKILQSTTVKAIFWGPSWATSPGDKITGLDSFYAGFHGSNYAKTTTEYSGYNGSIGTGSAYQGHLVDISTASGGGSTATILAEVCKQVTAGNIVVDASGNGYYPVYTDVPRGNAGYCAYHSTGTCGGKALQFAFFWKLEGDSGCNPQDTSTGNSEGLAALANVSAHELAEAITDPASPGAWYDASGSENGDKCAWTFGGPFATLSNGSIFKLQGEWSNSAFTASSGYPNSSGQRGCIGGL